MVSPCKLTEKMLLKVIIINYWVVIRNTIFSQPVNENNLISNTPQTSYEECCPCPNLLNDESNYRDQEFLPTYLPRVSTDDCPCLSSEADSLGSSSVFRPFLLRAAQSVERQRNPKQDVKPLLQPEVGLASSVLETLQKATDEEYEDALARDAARNAVKIGSDFFDTATGNSRNSVTIVLNPREDLYVDDTIPEASRIQETRCIHGPLGRKHMVDRVRVMNPISNEYLLKRKPQILSHRSYDMDNSASNIQEILCANDNNNLGSKLKMNPLLLNMLPNNVDRLFQDNSNPTSDSGHQLQKISPQCYDELNKNSNEQIINNPVARLAVLRNKLRDLSEIRNLRLLKNNLNSVKSNHLYNFNYKPDNSDAESSYLEVSTNSPVDTFFDKQSPIVKTILKLKDVELISPIKTINKGLMKEINADLKFAGTENNDYALETADNNIKEIDIETVKDDTITNDGYSSKLTNIQKEKKVKTNEDDEVEDSCEMQSTEQIKIESNDLNHSANEDTVQYQNNDSSIQGKKNINFVHNNFENESKDNSEDIEDTIPEPSNSLLQKLSQEEDYTLNDNTNFENNVNNEEVCQRQNFLKNEVDQIKSQRNLLEKNSVNGNLLQYNNDDLVSFKEGVLRKLENFKKTIKLKLQEPENNLSIIPKIDLGNILEEKTDDITDDLEKFSDSFQEKEKPLESESMFSQEIKCNNDDNFKSSGEYFSMSPNELSDTKILPTKLDSIETQLIGNPSSAKNDMLGEDDNSNLRFQQKDYLQNSNKFCDTVGDDNFDTYTEKVLRKDFLPINEMSSQASTFTFNAIQPPLQQSIIVQPSHLTDSINPVSNTLQIPSLEDIRQGITDIIKAGEQEVEEFRTAISDSLNESTNYEYNPLASANTNLRSKIFKMRPLKNTHANLSVNRHNIGPYKSKLFGGKTPPLKAITLKPLLNNKVGTREDILPLGSGRIKPEVKPSLKSPSKGFSLKEDPSLTILKEFLHNKSNFIPGMEIPRTNIDKIAIFSPQILSSIAGDIKYQSNNAVKSELKKTKEGKLLSKSKPESNVFLEAMDKNRENLNEKMETLHLNLNDRLASIHEKFLDQTNLQSINFPKTDRYNKSPLLLEFDRDTPSLNLLARKLHNIERNLSSGPRSLNMQGKTKSNDITPLNLSLPSKNTDDGKPIRKLSSFTPIRNSNVKIMFSTTTRPIVNTKLLKKPVLSYPLRKPLKLKDKNNDANKGFNLKSISEPNYSKYKSFGDTSKASSEPIQTKIPLLKIFSDENEKETNSHMNLDEPNFRHSTTLLESSQLSDLENAKKSSSLSNIRDALRARLENITRTPKLANTQDSITEGTNSDTMVLSPGNVKTSLFDGTLKENTSYKCSIKCIKE